MNLATGIVAFTMIWMVVFFMTLPFGIRTAEEDGVALEPGQAQSAPVRPRLVLKAAVTTGITAALFSLLWYSVTFDPLQLGPWFRMSR